METNVAKTSGSDQKLFSSLLGEISYLQEILNFLEGESVTADEAVSLVGGIQRDIVQLYRAAQG
jgi:hypothetical protein